MKKIALLTTFTLLTFAVFAQSLNVQSAMTERKRGYYNKAKKYIDMACEHEDTKNEAKTWYYAALIYSQIGEESKNPKSKYKDLDAEWLDKTYNAAMRCKELDKEGDYELGAIFRYVGSEYYNKSIPVFNSGDYTKALEIADKAIKIFNNSGDADLSNESMYIAGKCCQALHDNDGIKKYYGPLVRKSRVKDEFKSRMPEVYTVMYGVYKDANDTANVFKTAERYTKVMPEDPNANLLLAQAYIWTGNNAKGMELANKAVEESKNDPKAYPRLLCAAAGIYEQAGDYTSAEAKYKESYDLMPSQFEANYGMASMMNNRAYEKNEAINKMIAAGSFSDEDQVVMDKLTQERNDYLSKAIPYLKDAVAFIDALDADTQAQYRPQLHSCLRTLNTCYITLEMYNESKPVQQRIKEIEAAN